MSDITMVRLFLEAKTKTELVSKQLQNNMVNSCKFAYGDYIEQKNGSFIICFDADLEAYKHPDKIKLPRKPKLDDLV